MPTQKGGYFLKDGTRIPSVTTVLSKFRDPGPLMWWAAEEARSGRDYRETRDKAANAGTLAHRMVECDWRGLEWARDGEPDEIVGKAKKSFSSYLEWKDQTKLAIAEGELPLISEQYRFGGTFDALMVRNKLYMGDVKTGSAIYAEHLMQVAAYAQLWRENFPDRPLDGGFMILRFSKEESDFAQHFYGELDDAWEAFKHLRVTYDLVKKLEKRTR